jgi:hypothetical protein
MALSRARRATLVLLLGSSALVSACHHEPRTASEECYRRVALRRAFSGGRFDETAEAIQQTRCDAIASEERETAREEERRQEASRAESEERAHDDAQHFAAIRAAPRVPELGAMVPEMRATCEKQRAHFIQKSDAVYVCRLVGATLFACTVDDNLAADRCDGYYEGAELTDARDRVAETLGPPTSKSVTGGSRVFGWAGAGLSVLVQMYPHGVRMTTSRKPIADEQ